MQQRAGSVMLWSDEDRRRLVITSLLLRLCLYRTEVFRRFTDFSGRSGLGRHLDFAHFGSSCVVTAQKEQMMRAAATLLLFSGKFTITIIIIIYIGLK